MGVQRVGVEVGSFADFVAGTEAKLRIALIATYGPLDGHTAALDALSWAWEHWDRVQLMANPAGYLYRVGQTAARRQRSRPIPIDASTFRDQGLPEINPELIPALARLSAHQRTVVMLVHAFGWSIRDVARMLELAPSTIQTHLERGLGRLRDQLEERDEH
jgi:DNA-directed RNA polymerase specialized sigma24 family protein